MNVFNKVALQSLKKNRTRTIVTIIGVILSVAMVTAVTTFISSLQATLIKGHIARYGDWQVKFKDVDSEFVQKVSSENEVRIAYVEESNLYVSLKSPSKIYDFAKKATENFGYFSYEVNHDLLRYYGVSLNDNFNAVLYSFAAILIALIMIGSVLLIYNSFAISISERTRQFGILSSVGATKKQLRKSVLFEGAFIGMIGIPIGLVSGVAGIGITLRLIGNILSNMFMAADFSLSVSLPAMIVAVLAGALTIFVSAYIPAKKAVKKSIIETIRQTDDIKLKSKAVKSPKIVGMFFGLPGTLAHKNFKRNKKRYRSTVISLFVSVVLFVSASAFGMYLSQAAELTISNEGYDISFFVRSSEDEGQVLSLYERLKTATGITQSAYENTVDCFTVVQKGDLTKRYLDYYGYSLDDSEKNADCSLSVAFVDDATYGEYIKALGLSESEYGITQKKLVATAKIRGYDPIEQRSLSIEVFNKGAIALDISATKDSQPQKIELAVVESMPELFSSSQFGGIVAFAPYSDIEKFQAPKEAFNKINMVFSSSDPIKSAAEMEDMAKDEGIVSYYLFNVSEAAAQSRNLILVINIFTYGFVVLISLIAIANVFNTVSTSINLRRREFAMLRSVGLESCGFDKMMNFECVIYGLKALLYGLPVSMGISFLIYRAVQSGADVPFALPWSSIAISVFGVFFVVFVTMVYAVGKVKKENTIDALKSDVF